MDLVKGGNGGGGMELYSPDDDSTAGNEGSSLLNNNGPQSSSSKRHNIVKSESTEVRIIGYIHSLSLISRTTVMLARIQEEDACYCTRNLCVLSRIQKLIPELIHIT